MKNAVIHFTVTVYGIVSVIDSTANEATCV